jgi:hypothetical protein
MHRFSLAVWLVAILFSLVGNMFVGKTVLRLRKKHEIYKSCEDTTKSDVIDHYNRETGLLGFLELIAYFFSIVFNFSSFIGWWLGIKALGRWNKGGPPQEVDEIKDSDSLEVKSCKRKKAAAALNIFLIGNLMNVIFGVTGGLIAKNSFVIAKFLDCLTCKLIYCTYCF